MTTKDKVARFDQPDAPSTVATLSSYVKKKKNSDWQRGKKMVKNVAIYLQTILSPPLRLN